MTAAAIVFLVALVGIVTLFAHKAYELRASRPIAPGLRDRADESALEFKRFLARSQDEIKKLPPEVAYLGRLVLHDLALGAAASARFIERQSRRLADLVSHQRGFQRKETNSAFLKQVSEHKNGNDLETTSEDGQNS
ncbi:MAG: hypothetical protein JO019_01470 [Candidatus Kaiserbacteria bacterium]|nr:hypothetical protein [Candidatus Kaiserbacteria bacterium]